MHAHAASAYLQLSVDCPEGPLQEILIAHLSGLRFETFLQEPECLKAYILPGDYNPDKVQSALQQFNCAGVALLIEPQNWNAVWEASFEPVVVQGFCAVEADFHIPVAGVAHNIRITPRMAFGTGHHATTYMMLQQMQRLNFKGKSVLDFGTGTGLLAILAEKLGAVAVVGLEIDPNATQNATENAAANGCQRCCFLTGSMTAAPAGKRYDIILANINRGVLLQEMRSLAACCQPDGQLLLSGILAEDEPAILAAATANNFSLVNKTDRNGWLALLLNRSSTT